MVVFDRRVEQGTGRRQRLVVNDFVALAKGFDAPQPHRLLTGGGAPCAGVPKGSAGAGNRPSVVPPRDGGEVIVSGRGRDITLPCLDAQDWRVAADPHSVMGHVSAVERVWSGGRVPLRLAERICPAARRNRYDGSFLPPTSRRRRPRPGRRASANPVRARRVSAVTRFSQSAGTAPTAGAQGGVYAGQAASLPRPQTRDGLQRPARRSVAGRRQAGGSSRQAGGR